MSDEYEEEIISLDLPSSQKKPQYSTYNQPNQVYSEGGNNEEDRINKHIQKHAVGARGQALIDSNSQYQEPAPQQYRRPAGVAEHWADLHKEFADVLDINELQKFRKHFRAFGEKEGFITPEALHEIMETFFGQDLDRRQITETIAEIDYDNDGKISYREFLEVMCALKTNSKKSKFGNFYKVLSLKNPPFWSFLVGLFLI
jgi:hypothetical protein